MKNQMMTIKIGDYGTINIGHKDRMGKIQDVISMCNYADTLKGGKGNYTIDQALRSIDLWKYIFEVAVLNEQDSNSGESPDLKKPKSNSVESTELKKSKIIADYSLIYDNTDKF